MVGCSGSGLLLSAVSFGFYVVFCAVVSPWCAYKRARGSGGRKGREASGGTSKNDKTIQYVSTTYVFFPYFVWKPANKHDGAMVMA